MPRRSTSLAVLVCSLLGPAPPPAVACTTFCLQGQKGPLIGKSYDWDQEQAIVFTNPKGLAKRALLLDPKDRPAVWVAAHASLTFNQYGREFPNGGLNDAGLVVEIMWLDETRWPAPDARPAVTALQWIQLQLDTRRSVAEMAAAAQDVRVSASPGKVHYMACDRTGECAVFENLGGKMVVTRGREVGAKVLTNDTYAASAAALAQHRGFGGKKAIPADASSLSRFVRAASLLGRAAGKTAVERALAILDSVRNGDSSKWNIVYDPVALRVSFRTLSQPALKIVDFEKLAAACPAGARMLDMGTAEGGDVTARFQPYTGTENKRLIERSLAPLARELPPGAAGVLAAYPASMTCREAPARGQAR